LQLHHLQVEVLDMPVTFTSLDTLRATTRMLEAGAQCLITLGGDGTNRLVAQVCGDVPLVPISTGTNNVFPSMVEGTLAGLAAALVARGLAEAAVERAACLEVLRADHTDVELALVDVAVYAERVIGARAVWDPARILELVLARIEPGSIGLSSIGAHLGLEPPGPAGLYVRLSQDGSGQRVLAPIAPGVIAPVSIASVRRLGPGDEVCVCQPRPCTLAFDGERELAVAANTPLRIRLNAHGPRVVDVRRALAIAAQAGVFSGPTGRPC
jgi:predicted polyphosphate/ATP-dependent NAD kinase